MRLSDIPEGPRKLICESLQHAMLCVETDNLELLSRFRDIALALIEAPERNTPEARLASASAKQLQDEGLLDLLSEIIDGLQEATDTLKGPPMDLDSLSEMSRRLMQLREDVSPLMDAAEKMTEARKELALWN
jgi:hypothetical protein